MKSLIVLISLFQGLFLYAQKENQSLSFHFSWAEQSLVVDSTYDLPSQEDHITIEVVKLYISDVQFFKEGKLIHSLSKKYLLLDLEEPASLSVPIYSDASLEADKICFKLGIDSLTSVSGVFGGDLDPTNGMYWTWQSGYINTKIEGVSANCPARHKRFQFHIGGYASPYSTLKHIELALPRLDDVNIEIALDRFLEQINLAQTYQVMSPNQEAMKLAQILPAMFSVVP
ncbi:MAG: MbnP family protein [Bacteroidota bacterium]